MSISYHEQFRENHRNKNQNGLFSNSKATAGRKLPPQRPTAVVKQPLRSDTFTLPAIRDETNFRVPKVNQTQNGSRRQAANKPAVITSAPPAEQKRTEIMRKNGGTRPVVKQYNSTTVDRQNLQRKPVRFANNYDNTYYSSSPASPPVYYQKNAPLADPLPRDTVDKSRRMRITNDDYVVHRRKDSPAYAYSDYHTVSDIPTISYATTSLPPISQSRNQTAPTVIIHSKDTLHSDPPTIIPTVSTNPSYLSSAPMMFLPSSTVSSYPQTSTMILPNTMGHTQQPVHSFFLPPQSTSNYVPQSFFYPIPYSNLRPNFPPSAPPPPPVPPPPPPPHQTIISQSSSSSVSAPAPVKTENKTEENNATIIVHPNMTNNNKKNVTIQLKMVDEESPRDNTRSQRVVRVVRDSPYREADDVYYVESEPKHIIYEQPRRQTAYIRRPPVANEYVYVDESPSTVVRRRPPHRSEVVYVDNDRPLEYEEEVVYVDDNDNEIEYIYDDEPNYHRRNHTKFRHPSSTNIVYE